VNIPSTVFLFCWQGSRCERQEKLLPEEEIRRQNPVTSDIPQQVTRSASTITVVPYPAWVTPGNMQIVVWQFWGRAAGSVLNRKV
jgi:hypothetical protein